MSTTDIVGLTSLANRDNINQGLDLGNVERGYMNGDFSGAVSPIDFSSDDALDEYDRARNGSDETSSADYEISDDSEEVDIPAESAGGLPMTDMYFGRTSDRKSNERRVMEGLEKDEYELIHNRRIDEEEKKMKMLLDIDNLMKELKVLKEDTSHLMVVNKSSSYSMVENAHGHVTRLYNRVRCTHLGNELFISLISVVTTVFNGERSLFGFKPDLTNWEHTIRTKLPRMNFEISNMAASVVDGLGIGSGGRLLMELIPSAILHNATRKSQTEKGEKDFIPASKKKSNIAARSMHLEELESFS